MAILVLGGLIDYFARLYRKLIPARLSVSFRSPDSIL